MTATEFQNGLRQGAEALRNTQPLMQDCAKIVCEDLRQSMRAGVSPDGSAFLPLKHPRVSGNTGPPLNDYGLLNQSLIGGPDHIEVIRKDGFTIGTRRIGATIHQYGGWIFPVFAKALAIPIAGGGVAFAQKVYVPARPFVGISNRALEAIKARIFGIVGKTMGK